MVPKRLCPNTDLGTVFAVLYLSLIPTICLVLSCTGQSEGSVTQAEPQLMLLVFHDPNCRRCVEDEPIVELIVGRIDMTFYGWSDKEAIKSLRIKGMPTYVLLSIEEDGSSEETWRTRSAAVAYYRLGFTE